jgi:type IV secretory pathway component VirB8
MPERHHYHKSGASLFKEKSLHSIAQRRKTEKWLKRILTAIAVIMVLVVIAVYVLW